MWNKIKPFAITIGITLLVGGLAGLLTMNSTALYQDLTLPPLSPPDWVFPVVWTILYVLMGVAAGLVLRLEDTPARNEALLYYALQLMVNFLWPIVFFAMESFWLAFALILLLVWLIVNTILAFRPLDSRTTWLLLPYLLWTLFATYLNLGVAILN